MRFLLKGLFLNFLICLIFVPTFLVALRADTRYIWTLLLTEFGAICLVDAWYWRRHADQIKALHNRLRLYDTRVAMRWHSAVVLLMRVLGWSSLALGIFSPVYFSEGRHGFAKPDKLAGGMAFVIGIVLYESADKLAEISGSRASPFWMKLAKLSSLFVALIGVLAALLF